MAPFTLVLGQRLLSHSVPGWLRCHGSTDRGVDARGAVVERRPQMPLDSWTIQGFVCRRMCLFSRTGSRSVGVVSGVLMEPVGVRIAQTMMKRNGRLVELRCAADLETQYLSVSARRALRMRRAIRLALASS